MKILLINHYAGSPKYGMEYRPYFMAREWVRLGHEVTIVAASRSHVRRQNPALKGSMQFETIDGIRYCWLWTPDYNGNGVGRVLNIFVFLLQLFFRAGFFARLAQGGSVVASSTYPFDVIAARTIAHRADAKLTYEVHDLWPLSPIELGGMSPKHPFIRAVQWAEDFAYRNVDIVVSILPLTEPYMRKHGLAPGKFRYVPNGIDLDEKSDPAALPEAHRAALDRLHQQGRFVIGYAGAHGIANSLDTVLHAAALLKDQPISFVLVGMGPEKEKLQQLAQSLRLDNVMFLPPAPKAAIPAMLDKMDSLLIALRPTWIFSLGISPNKLMDYMISGRPVIQAIDAGNDMVTESGCGISVSAGNPNDLAEAALRMAGTCLSERVEMGNKGKEYVLRNHDLRLLARQFLGFISHHPSAQKNVAVMPSPYPREEYRPTQSI